MAQEEAKVPENQQEANPVEHEQDAKLSDILHDALQEADGESLTVGEIIDRVADRGFGLVLVLISLPTMIPILPPGASAVVGVLFSILGIQLIFGSHQPYMPKWVRRYKLSPKMINGLKTRGLKWIKKIERISKQRWPFMRRNISMRILGLVMVAIGIVLFLPLPFLNTLPGLALLVMGIGLANHDGLLVFIAAVVCTALVLVAVFFGHLLIALYHWLKAQLFGAPVPAK